MYLPHLTDLLQDLKSFYDKFTTTSRDEVEEFIDLVKEKMECEYARAECLDKMSNFELNHLKDSPFEQVAQGLIRKADNEAY